MLFNRGPKPTPKKKKNIYIIFWWGASPPTRVRPRSGDFFLGLVDSSLTGSRSTAYQNRPGFSVLHAQNNKLTDCNRHFTNLLKIFSQFTNCLITQIDANIYISKQFSTIYIFINIYISIQPNNIKKCYLISGCISDRNNVVYNAIQLQRCPITWGKCFVLFHISLLFPTKKKEKSQTTP